MLGTSWSLPKYFSVSLDFSRVAINCKMSHFVMMPHKQQIIIYNQSSSVQRAISFSGLMK